VVLLHLKPLTRDESSGLPMITVDGTTAMVIVKRILFNVSYMTVLCLMLKETRDVRG